MTHTNRSLELGIYGKDIIHNPNDKSYEGYFPEEEPYQITNFLDEDELKVCRDIYYNNFDSAGVKLYTRHFFITYPLDIPEVGEILKPKLNSLFGEWYSYRNINSDEFKQSSDFYFFQKTVFAPHTDSIIHIPDYVPYKDVLIPLEIDNDVKSPYYSLNQRWYGRGTHFKQGMIDDVFGMYSNTFREHSYDYYGVKYVEKDPSKMIDKYWYDEYFNEISGYPISIFEGFSIRKHFLWTPASAIVSDTNIIHGATNYNVKGGKYKLGITLRIFKKVPGYNPNTLFSRYPPKPGFKECSNEDNNE